MKASTCHIYFIQNKNRPSQSWCFTPPRAGKEKQAESFSLMNNLLLLCCLAGIWLLTSVWFHPDQLFYLCSYWIRLLEWDLHGWESINTSVWINRNIQIKYLHIGVLIPWSCCLIASSLFLYNVLQMIQTLSIFIKWSKLIYGLSEGISKIFCIIYLNLAAFLSFSASAWIFAEKNVLWMVFLRCLTWTSELFRHKSIFIFLNWPLCWNQPRNFKNYYFWIRLASSELYNS